MLWPFCSVSPPDARPRDLQVLGEGDTILADQTGSGKTLAYLAPVVQTLREAERTDGRTESTMVRALVLVPTAELAQQVEALSFRLEPCPIALVLSLFSWSSTVPCPLDEKAVYGIGYITTTLNPASLEIAGAACCAFSINGRSPFPLCHCDGRAQMGHTEEGGTGRSRAARRHSREASCPLERRAALVLFR